MQDGIEQAEATLKDRSRFSKRAPPCIGVADLCFFSSRGRKERYKETAKTGDGTITVSLVPNGGERTLRTPVSFCDDPRWMKLLPSVSDGDICSSLCLESDDDCQNDRGGEKGDDRKPRKMR